jgi:hypothetical protein
VTHACGGEERGCESASECEGANTGAWPLLLWSGEGEGAMSGEVMAINAMAAPVTSRHSRGGGGLKGEETEGEIKEC